jgi:hypothetical protein
MSRKKLNPKRYFSKFGTLITSSLLISNTFRYFITILLQSFTPFNIKDFLMTISKPIITQQNR